VPKDSETNRFAADVITTAVPATAGADEPRFPLKNRGPRAPPFAVGNGTAVGV